MGRVRHPTNQEPEPASPCSPLHSSWHAELEQLQRSKQAAVAREDFLMARQIKQRMATLEQRLTLQKQKLAAVAAENFVLAMHLKQQIAALDEEAQHAHTTETAAPPSPVSEVK